jgi:hypothetical protein
MEQFTYTGPHIDVTNPCKSTIGILQGRRGAPWEGRGGGGTRMNSVLGRVNDAGSLGLIICPASGIRA